MNLAATVAAGPIFEVKPLRGIDFLFEFSYATANSSLKLCLGGAALFDYNNDGPPRHIPCKLAARSPIA